MRIPEGLHWQAAGATLGEGGQGTVLEVVDKSATNGPKRAMKKLSGRSAKALQRFEREVQAIRSLDHPSIVKVLDWSLDAKFPYLVMELVEGATPLKKLLENKANPYYARPIAALGFFRRLLEVIRACESVKVVHRDLSPSNVLVLPNEDLRVIDFGLCQVEGATPVTVVDEGVGTQNYMAPECEAGADARITSAADLYSAGKLLWSAVTGLFAFAREAPVFNAKSMKKVFPDSPSLWHLQHAFLGTIRRDPSKRWKDAQEALSASARIERLVEDGYPPLDLLNRGVCPVCGIGRLAAFPNAHLLFQYANQAGIQALKCETCGFCFPIDRSRLQESIRTMESAD